MKKSIAFILCTEKGRLESQSSILVESIRQYAGDLSNAAIYTFQPRKGREISQETLNLFEKWGVFHKTIVLNNKYPNYPISNKVYVCSWAEKNLDYDIICFLDSDQIVFQEPKKLLLEEEYDVAVRPVFKQTPIGTTGEGHPNEVYWQSAYEICETKYRTFTNSTVDQVRIRTQWNSGLVAVRREAGIFSLWEENFDKCYLQLGHNIMTDQLTLAATIGALTDRIKVLPKSYNYPLAYHNFMVDTSQQLNSFDDIVTCHYLKVLEQDIWKQTLGKLKKFDKKNSKYKWFYDRLEHYQPYNFYFAVAKNKFRALFG